MVVTQSGRIELRHFFSISLLAVAFGITFALIRLPRWLNLASSVAGVGVLVFSLFVAVAPAQAQVSCQLIIIGGGASTDLLTTTAEAPFTIDLSEERTFEVQAVTPSDASTVEVVARQILHVGFLAQSPETVLWYGSANGGVAGATVTSTKDGPTGAQLSVQDLSNPNAPPQVSAIPPWGAVELTMRVDRIAGSVRSNVCTESIFLKFVAKPIGTPLGRGGLAAATVGLAGLVGTAALRRRWMDPESRPQPRREPAFVAPAEPIPSVGPHAPYVESNFVDVATQEPIDPGQPLVVGRDYVLRLNLTPAVRADDAVDEVPISAKASGDGVAARPVVQLGVAGTPLAIDLPVKLNRTGRQGVDVDLIASGHLLQTEHYELTVVDSTDDGDQTARGQTVTTVFSASDFSPAHLRSLKPRALIVILQYDSDDGSVDSRILDPAGNLLLRHDSVLQPEALVRTAEQVRKVLRSVLGDEAIQRTIVSDEHAAAAIMRMAKVGRLMHQTLFPAEAQPGAGGTELGGVQSNAIIQAVQNGGGLGLATMPWNLIYDRPVEESGAGNKVCPEFPDHPVDACPNVTNPTVICPTGFWGFRYVIEQPLTATDNRNVADELLPQSSEVASGGIASAYLDSTLSYAASHRAALERATTLSLPTSYDDVIAGLRSDANDLFYFYTHHAEEPDLGIPGMFIEGHILTASALRDLRLRWTRYPLVVINACASGDYGLDDPLSLLHEFRAAGAAGVITTECTVFDPLAGQLAHRMLDAFISGQEVGPAVLKLRRELMTDNNNPLGFAYAIHALADVTVELQPATAEAVAA